MRRFTRQPKVGFENGAHPLAIKSDFVPGPWMTLHNKMETADDSLVVSRKPPRKVRWHVGTNPIVKARDSFLFEGRHPFTSIS